MIGKITTWVLRNKATVLVGLAVFIGFGVQSYLELPVEAYPDVTNVSVQIITLFPGHAAEEVERLVTIPGSRPRDGGRGGCHRPEGACHLSSRRCRRTPREGPGSATRSWRR